MKKQAKGPKFRVGQVVAWKGQSGQCYGLIIRITEPQPGNYVLWMDIGSGAEIENQFPSNHQQVRPLTVRKAGPARGRKREA